MLERKGGGVWGHGGYIVGEAWGHGGEEVGWGLRKGDGCGVRGRLLIGRW